MRIAAVYLRDFAPFSDQPVVFTPKQPSGQAEVHFFVGQNGTGKTRLLSLLAAACGNAAELEFRESKFASTVVVSGFKNGNEQFTYFQPGHGVSGPHPKPLSEIMTIVAGFKTHNEGKFAILKERRVVSMAFRSVPSLEDQKIIAMGPVKWPNRDDYLRFTHHASESTLLCQALANLKIRMGIVSNDPKDRTVRMIRAFDNAIKDITGQDLVLTVGYVDQELKLSASWAGKNMQLKQLPDGLRSICGWLASCVVKLDELHPKADNPLEEPLILLLDEPDAHLHPAWQRKLIPAVQRLLPNAQIFVATHSPFVISSVNEGSIYVFNADANGKVTIEPPRPCGLGDSYIDVVEDVLGIREQFDPETENLLAEFRSKRDAIKAEGEYGGIDELKTMASRIAGRGETLKFMMGREIAQLENQLKRMVG